MSTLFKEVREIQDGGTGVPAPTYLLTHKGQPLHVFPKGSAREALASLVGCSADFALVACIDGKQREVARGGAALR